MAEENPLRRTLEEQSLPPIYNDILIETAIKHGLPPNYLIHLQQRETPDIHRYDPRTAEGPPTKSGVVHKGILQLSPGMARQYKADPFNVYDSADAAARMAKDAMAVFKKEFPNLTPEELLHLGALSHNQGTAPIIRAGGKVPSTTGAQGYSNFLKFLERADKNLVDAETTGPKPPPAAPKPRGAAAQPMKKGSIYNIQQMFGSTGEYVPGVDVFSRG